MQEYFEKIKERLERERDIHIRAYDVAIQTHERAGYASYARACDEAIEIVNQVAEEYTKDINVPGDDGWIPCSERLPEDGDCRFYMCIVENHEDDVPMFCQFEEEYGFGYWQDIYDEYSLGFLDSEFLTNEELGYEKVIAWQPLPAPYQPKGE